jgi:cytochrome c oxidase subunit IV
MAAATRQKYLIIFVLLTVLTALEIGVTYLGLEKKTLVWLLIAMAVGKAGLVAFYYMHLGTETRGLKLSVIIPFCIPAIYALILMAETAWRLLP